MLVSISKALRSPALKRPLSNVIYRVKCLWTGISFSHLRFQVVLTLAYQQGAQPVGWALFEEMRHSLFPREFLQQREPTTPCVKDKIVSHPCQANGSLGDSGFEHSFTKGDATHSSILA